MELELNPDVVLAALRRRFREDGIEECHAVIDAARLRVVADLAVVAGLTPKSLFEGKGAARLWGVAPHHVRFRVSHDFLAILAACWGSASFILFGSVAGDGEIRQSLRSLMLSREPDGVVDLYRFYDPRVFLGSTSRLLHSHQELLRLIGCFYVEDREGSSVRICRSHLGADGCYWLEDEREDIE